MPMWQSGPIAAVWVCLVGCVATSQGYWLGDCGGYAGPLPLAPLGNSDLDCKLKGLGLRFGLQLMGGGRSVNLHIVCGECRSQAWG
jgi:hypothetical protein